ncbi:MAG: hypothetical protein ACRDYZ_07930 [Acidimicrobiales bacterium]
MGDPGSTNAAIEAMADAMWREVAADGEPPAESVRDEWRTLATVAWEAAAPLVHEGCEPAGAGWRRLEEAHAEAERLRAYEPCAPCLHDDHEHCTGACMGMCCALAASEAEVERLREALGRIATQCVPEDSLAVLVARAALHPEETDG